MNTMHKFRKFLLILSLVLLPITASAQSASLWRLSSSKLQPVVNTWSLKVPSLNASGTKCLHVNATGDISATSSDCGSGSGTVTSVGLSVPSGFSVSGSPITSSGTLAITTALNGLLYGTGSGLSTATVSSPLSFSAGTLSISNIPNASLANSSITVSSGTSGSDFNVSGSPVSLGGTVTLNIPDAGASARGLITTGSQTLAGAKTFTSGLTIDANAGLTVKYSGLTAIQSTNSATSGGLFINNKWDSAWIPLQVQGASAQSADIFQILNSSGSVLSRFNSVGKLGIGTSPSAFAHIVGTTEQLRLGYDATYYVSHTVANTTGNYTMTFNGGTTSIFGLKASNGVGIDIALPTNGLNYIIGYNTLRLGANGGIGGYFDSSNNFGLGMDYPTSISARLHVVKTTEQVRIGYNTSNYLSQTVGSSGIATWLATGSSAQHRFNDSVSGVPTYIDGNIDGNYGFARFSTPSKAGGYRGGFDFWMTTNNGTPARAFTMVTDNATFTTRNPIFFVGPWTTTNMQNYIGTFNPTIGTLSSQTSGDRYSLTGTVATTLAYNLDEGNYFALGSIASGNSIEGAFFGTQYRPVVSGYSSDAIIKLTNEDRTKSEWFRLKGTTGRLGLNTGSTVSAQLHVIQTTEQLRLGYDTSNYFSTTISSSGNATLNLIAGSGVPRFSFSDGVTLPAGTATANSAPILFTSGTNLTTAEAGAMEYDGTSLFFTNDGAQRQELIQTQQSRVSSQFDKTNTTLANVTGLTASVVAGKVYKFEANLYFDADATGGSKFAIAGTATATAIIYHVDEICDATNAFTINSRQTALAGSAGQAGCTAGVTKITGTITVNAGGTLTVQFAQNASNGTSSVLVGSTFKTEQIP